MATYTGENGTVKIGTDSAGEVAIAEVRSWTVEHTKDVIEDTVMGDAARTYKSGLHTFTGSMEVVYDDGHTTSNAFRPDSDSALYVEFYPSASAGQKFTGQIIVTSVSRTASYDDLVTSTVNFQGTGALDVQAYNA
ncbi:major tail protein [Phage DSL-LC06]|nr:major tail protein [Phage DSL-LC06]